MTKVDTDGPELGDLLAMSVTLAMYLVVGFGLGWLVDLPLHSFPAVALARSAGFGLESQWFDPERLFSENLLRPE